MHLSMSSPTPDIRIGPLVGGYTAFSTHFPPKTGAFASTFSPAILRAGPMFVHVHHKVAMRVD